VTSARGGSWDCTTNFASRAAAQRTDHVRLKALVLATRHEGRDPHRPNLVWFGEIALQDGQGALRIGVVEQRLQLRRDVFRAGAIVPDDVAKVVGVLVLSAAIESEGLQHHVCACIAHPYVPRRLLAEDGRADEGHLLSIPERAPQPRGDDGSEVWIEVAELAALVPVERWLNQEVDRHASDTRDGPA